ncbi:hypothetical protein [Pseudonocardia sp.]|uniref:hypothetical protein n=1 Tax=Pseudonocardia sp. TaxID=60912 RepID=UPI003D0EC802
MCDVIFSDRQAGQPVYLDMDDAVLSAVAARAGASAASTPTQQLVEAVRGTLILKSGPSDVFRGHLLRLERWRRAAATGGSAHIDIPPPPTVGLLALFTVAAEAMGSDTSYAVHAYYPRLSSLLEVETDTAKDRLSAAYRADAERLWKGLNDWLTATDGRYGVPTAYALTHRYIGLPLSQALVRAADRRHLSQMFRQYGLPPGSEVPPADMQRLLDAWMQQSPCPASNTLQALWQRPAAQERIAEVAALELLSWDSGTDSGVVGERSTRHSDVLLLAQLRRFPRPGLELSFLVRSSTGGAPDHLTVLGENESERQLEAMPLGGGLVRPRSAGDVDAQSLVEGVLQVSDPDSAVNGRRFPRRVVPLRRDEQANAFVECERVQLGEDLLLLVRDEGPLLREVQQLLSEIARPGYSVSTSFPGLPHGWALVTDLQVLANPRAEPTRTDLNALVALLSSQLSIAGGLRLPGNLRKWSSLHAPEVRAITQVEGELTLSLTRSQFESGEETVCQEWRSQRGVVVVDLADLGLDDGDYEITLAAGCRVLQRTVLRLRSSDTPDLYSWGAQRPLAHCLDQPSGVLAATPLERDVPDRVRGVMTYKSTERSEPLRSAAAPGAVWWTAPAPTPAPIAPILIAAPAPGSCVVTGAHRIQLPPSYGRATAKMMTGECTQCGLVKRYPTWLPRYGRRDREHDGITLDPTRLQNLPDAEAQPVSRDAVLDGLVHVGGGTAGSLERLVTQVDGSALAVSLFLRDLEVLGHVDVQRDTRSEMASWQAAPTCLAEVADGSFVLTGAWSARARDALQTLVERAGGELTVEDNGVGPTSWFVEGLLAEQLADLVIEGGLGDDLPSGATPHVVSDAASLMLSALPRLTDVERHLARVALPGARRVERFDLQSASWQAVLTAEAAGAYRLHAGFRSTHVFRSERDVDHGEAAIGTVHLVKHLEALRTGRPLIAHYPAKAYLAVPLGADLPGLYGRAAVLCSGRLPGQARKQKSRIYHEVPAAFATRLYELFASK